MEVSLFEIWQKNSSFPALSVPAKRGSTFVHLNHSLINCKQHSRPYRASGVSKMFSFGCELAETFQKKPEISSFSIFFPRRMLEYGLIVF